MNAANALFLAAGLLASGIAVYCWRQWRIELERCDLVKECMREAMKGRDEMYAELIEERKRAYEMQLELDSYREEEAIRQEAKRVMRKLRAN